MRFSRLVCVVLVVGLTGSLSAQDWPQFGGLERDGKSPEVGLLTEWPANGPELSWKSEGVGTGYSSLAIVGEMIFTIGDVDDDQFLFAVSRDGGEPIWKQRIGDSNPTSYPGSRCTPTFSDGKVYALSTTGSLFCVNADDGNFLWSKDLKQEFNAQLMLAMDQYEWQFSESPFVDEKHVVVTPGASDAAMVALNKQTGETVWKTSLPDSVGDLGADGAGYCSIVAAEIKGKRQLIQLYGRGVMGVDAETGEYLWGYNRVANKIANVSSAAVMGNHVFVSTGYQTGSALLEIDHVEGKWSATEKYFLNSRVFQNHHGGFVLHDGHIYGGHGHKLGFPICLDLEKGELAWGPERNRGRGSASVAVADGHIYMRYEDGLMVLVQATPNGYTEKGAFMIPDVTAKSWSRPVIAGGKLYLKEQGTIYCYNISA